MRFTWNPTQGSDPYPTAHRYHNGGGRQKQNGVAYSLTHRVYQRSGPTCFAFLDIAAGTSSMIPASLPLLRLGCQVTAAAP